VTLSTPETDAGPFQIAEGRQWPGGSGFIILVEGDHQSKPLTEADARLALHKMGNSAAVIESMFDHARNAFRAEPQG
jgi:hypothetical protein